MWHDHQFSQRNKATKRAGVGVEFGGQEGVGQNLKKRAGGRQYRGRLRKIVGLGE